jgi:serine-type D-Ala-D-Ala carboxypeptidase (penicillin-binding protein 5/6)
MKRYIKLNLIIITIFLLFSNKLLFAFDISANKAILMDAHTSEVIFEKNAEMRTYPSSMAKIMTAYVIFDMLNNKEIKLDDKVRISEQAWKEKGSRMFLNYGSFVSFDELLHGLITSSGNDAATALAEGSPQGYNNFIQRMNETAKEIGLKNSNFSNSVGWAEAQNYMTLKDIAVLSQKLIQNFPEYYKKYFAIRDYRYNNIRQPNRNWLLWEYEGTDGLKTGHTKEGGYGTVVSAVRNNRRLIAAVNGLSGERERTEQAKRLLRYGFDVCERVELFKKNVEVGKAKIWMGKHREVALIAKDNIYITVEKRYIENVTYKIEYGDYVKAPIKKDDVIGKLIVKAPQEREISYDLYSAEDIDRLGFVGRIWFWIKYQFSKIF